MRDPRREPFAFEAISYCQGMYIITIVSASFSDIH